MKSAMPPTKIGAPVANVEPARTSVPKGAQPTVSPLPTTSNVSTLIGRPLFGPDLTGSAPLAEPVSLASGQNPSYSPAKESPAETLTQNGSAGPMYSPAKSKSPEPVSEPTNLATSTPHPKVTAQPTSTAGSSTRPTSPFNSSTTGVPGFSPKPTAAPAEGAPSSVLSRNQCETNENGAFGEVTSEGINVDFSYELETTSGDVVNEIIPALEKAFNDRILPYLFGLECSVLAESVLGSAAGMSARPDDSILRDISCSKKDVDTDDCVVVKGGLTVFIPAAMGKEDENVIIADVISVLQQGMQNGGFNYVNKGVVRVTYVEIEAQNPSQGEKAGGSVQVADTSRNNGLVYGVVAGAATCVIASVVFIYNRRRKENGDTETIFTGNTPNPNHVDV